MKKMYIVVNNRWTTRKICTDDLSKMYYYHKRRSPRLPQYS